MFNAIRGKSPESQLPKFVGFLAVLGPFQAALRLGESKAVGSQGTAWEYIGWGLQASLLFPPSAQSSHH